VTTGARIEWRRNEKALSEIIIMTCSHLWRIMLLVCLFLFLDQTTLAFPSSRLFQSKINGEANNANINVDVDVGITIRDCRYAELNPVSDLVVQSFYSKSQLQQDVFKHMYRLAELNRLQQNFPYMDPDRHRMLVATLNNDNDDDKTTIVGFVDIDARPATPNWHYQNNPRPMLSDLLTCPQHRRQGIARQLIQTCETICKQDFECDDIFIRVLQDNTVALQMYATMGYEVVDNPGDPENVKLLQKHLD